MHSLLLEQSTIYEDYLWWSSNFHKRDDSRHLVCHHNVKWGPNEEHTQRDKDTTNICTHSMEAVEYMARQKITIYCNWKRTWTYRRKNLIVTSRMQTEREISQLTVEKGHLHKCNKLLDAICNLSTSILLTCLLHLHKLKTEKLLSILILPALKLLHQLTVLVILLLLMLLTK